jgi:hypothetical protein
LRATLTSHSIARRIVRDRRIVNDLTRDAKHLACVDVIAIAIDIQVVREEDRERNVRGCGNVPAAAVGGGDDVGGGTILTLYANAEWLYGELISDVRARRMCGKPTSPSCKLSQFASMVPVLTNSI